MSTALFLCPDCPAPATCALYGCWAQGGRSFAAPAMVPQVCQQAQADAGGEWISPRDRLPPEGQTIEISVLANSLDVSTGKRLGNDWYLDRRYGGSVLMGEPSAPAYWRPVARASKAAA